MPRPWSAAMMAAALTLLALPGRSDPHGDGRFYFRAVYDFEVALHCGLVDQRLARAYHGARTQTAKQSSLSKEALRRLRLRAMVAADLEYDNRSLGGHRQWCAGEGRRGVARLLKYLD